MRNALMCGFLLAMIACGGGGSGASQPSTVSRPIRGPADLITEAEISATTYQNALEIVQNLRPTMMRPRGSTGQGPVPVVLFVDDVRMVDLNGLANVPANRIKEIRYINARDATTRWGTDVGSGVILVTTKR
jgi:hypothetical protein